MSVPRDAAPTQPRAVGQGAAIRTDSGVAAGGPSAAELQDTSYFYRFGCKGPRAAEWLTQHGITVPALPNTWGLVDSEDPASLIARLGNSEFFIEFSQRSDLLQRLATELSAPLDGVYPVLREDRALVLSGADAPAVLAQVCNVDFKNASRSGRELVMTLMVGIAVLVIPQRGKWGQSPISAERQKGTVPDSYRIWCDPTFGDYLWSTLQDVIRGV
jgi:sarcosine oxidase, subunit gamma